MRGFDGFDGFDAIIPDLFIIGSDVRLYIIVLCKYKDMYTCLAPRLLSLIDTSRYIDIYFK